jgi:hypothetical protein
LGGVDDDTVLPVDDDADGDDERLTPFGNSVEMARLWRFFLRFFEPSAELE